MPGIAAVVQEYACSSLHLVLFPATGVAADRSGWCGVVGEGGTLKTKNPTAMPFVFLLSPSISDFESIAPRRS